MRDLDLYSQYRDKCFIVWSITTLDEGLKRLLEPGASTSKGMLKAMAAMAKQSMTIGASIDPIIPGLTDEPRQLRELISPVAAHGGKFVAAAFLRLPAY